MKIINNFFLYNNLTYKNKKINKKYFNFFNNYNIFFLRKERIYTKLKYSRVPQFDTSSGAIASLLAALLGFLITEKFGFELIDSGDFYLIIMYLIFLIIILKVYINTISLDNNFLIISFYNVFYFFNIIITILFKLLKKKLKKLVK